MEATRYLPCSLTHVAYQCKKDFTPKVSVYKQKGVSCSCISCESNPEWISSAQSTVGASCISCRKKCNVDTGKFLEGVSSVRPHSSVQRTLIAGTRRSSRGATVVPAPPVEPIERVGPIEPTLPEGSPLEDIYNMFFLIQTSAVGREAEAMKESFRKNKQIKRTLDDNLKRIETDKFNLLKINGNPDYCWLCGFFIDERVNYLKMQIEHPLAIKLLGSIFGTPDLASSVPCIKRLFALNFLPSHEHCNQIKSQMFFVKWNKGILEPDLDVISFFLQKLLNGEKQSDNTNLFKRGSGTPLLRELIASQKFHMDITKNLAKWAIQRYSFLIHKIQDLCDIVNINNNFYTKWKSNIVERNYPSPEFNDTQNREIICKYNRDLIQNYFKKDEQITIINKYRSASQKAASDAAIEADRIRQERRGSLRPEVQRKKQYGGAISNNVTIEETYTKSKTKRDDIWIITQKIYELIGANVENIFFAKGTRNDDLLERLKDELKNKHTEVVQEMDNTIDKCLEIFTENLKNNEPMEQKAYDIYNDEKLNKEIFTNDWDTFLSEMELINRNIYDFLTTVTPVNGLANATIRRTFSQSFLPTGARQRIRTSSNSPNTVFRPLGFQPRTASVSPVLPRPASVSPALPRTASVSPAFVPRPASTPIARRTSFNEAEEEQSYEGNLLLPSSPSPVRSLSRSGLLRLAGAGAAVLASGAFGARNTPFTPITPTSFIGNPIYEDSRLGRTRKRKNLKRKTRKHRK